MALLSFTDHMECVEAGLFQTDELRGISGSIGCQSLQHFIF